MQTPCSGPLLRHKELTWRPPWLCKISRTCGGRDYVPCAMGERGRERPTNQPTKADALIQLPTITTANYQLAHVAPTTTTRARIRNGAAVVVVVVVVGWVGVAGPLLPKSTPGVGVAPRSGSVLWYSGPPLRDTHPPNNRHFFQLQPDSIHFRSGRGVGGFYSRLNSLLGPGHSLRKWEQVQGCVWLCVCGFLAAGAAGERASSSSRVRLRCATLRPWPPSSRRSPRGA